MAADGPLPIGAGRIGMDVRYFFPFRGPVIGANHTGRYEAESLLPRRAVWYIFF